MQIFAGKFSEEQRQYLSHFDVRRHILLRRDSLLQIFLRLFHRSFIVRTSFWGARYNQNVVASLNISGVAAKYLCESQADFKVVVLQSESRFMNRLCVSLSPLSEKCVTKICYLLCSGKKCQKSCPILQKQGSSWNILLSSSFIYRWNIATDAFDNKVYERQSGLNLHWISLKETKTIHVLFDLNDVYENENSPPLKY